MKVYIEIIVKTDVSGTQRIKSIVKTGVFEIPCIEIIVKTDMFAIPYIKIIVKTDMFYVKIMNLMCFPHVFQEHSGCPDRKHKNIQGTLAKPMLTLCQAATVEE